MNRKCDACVIGGGFYGISIALHMRRRYKDVIIVEKENQLLARASYANQARVHGGYHYVRSLITALRTTANFSRFVDEFKECINDEFESLYAIAKYNSKIDKYHFEEFCRRVGAPFQPAPANFWKFFVRDYISALYLVREVVFDALLLRDMLKRKLEEAGVTVLYGIEAQRVEDTDSSGILVYLSDSSILHAGEVFHCGYSNINPLMRASGLPPLSFKHEFAEVALIEVPEELRHKAITIMDGPFFSIMPFPPRNLHTLSHVRYTPHFSWYDNGLSGPTPIRYNDFKPASNYMHMLKDAQQYVPLLSRARYVDSLYEIKTVLPENEMNDGRPILFCKDYGMQNFSVVMGAKIDNIYDVLEEIA